MAQLLDHVEPGSVITAEQWNLVIDAINGLLQASVTAPGFAVATIVPEGTVIEPARVGAALQINGQNFGYAIGQSTVRFEASFGSVTITRDRMMTGSSDTRLVFVVPSIPNLPAAGANMTLRVSNGITSETRTVFVMPIPVVLAGDIFVTWRSDVSPNPQPNPLQASPPGGPNQSADFFFRLQTGINMPAAFDLVPAITGSPAIPAGLLESIEFLDETRGTQISTRRIELGATDTRNLRVRIPAIPAAWASQPFRLSITARSGTLTNTDTRSFSVGTPVQPSDPNIEIRPTDYSVFNVTTGDEDIAHANGVLVGSTLRLRTGHQLVVMLDVTFRQSGTAIYDIFFPDPAVAGVSGWSPQLVATPAFVSVNQNENKLIQFSVSLGGAAPANGVLVLRIQRRGATTAQVREYNVELMT